MFLVYLEYLCEIIYKKKLQNEITQTNFLSQYLLEHYLVWVGSTKIKFGTMLN